ncbi:MAG TPA: divalent metal cation transporter, partial [Longimicrobiaceae bacterium]|nr:divalent metal cation transporter [Longimicrobiaceae bacterium]
MRPIPAIILAQALNGVVLPFAAVFLLLVVNDRAVMGERGINGALSNTLMGLTVAVTLVLGVSGVLRAAAAAAGVADPGEWQVLGAAAVIAALLL